MDDETSNCVIHFISQNKKLNTINTNQHSKSYSFECLGVKKRITFDITIDHYRSRVDTLLMIIQGTHWSY